MESVVREAAKVDVRELRHDIMVRKATTRMYTVDAETEETAWQICHGGSHVGAC
jgi:hypothetical protein